MTSLAETKPSCSVVLAACDKALKDSQNQVTIRDQQLSQAELALKRQTDVAQAAQDKLDVWYRSPAVLLLLGVVAGFVVSEKVGK